MEGERARLQAELEAAWNRFDNCDPELSDACCYEILAIDRRLQVVVVEEQRALEIARLEHILRTSEDKDEILQAEQALMKLREARPPLPTDGHAEIRQELLRRIGYLPREEAS